MKNKKKDGEVEAVRSLPRKQSNDRKKSIMNSGKTVLGILASIGIGVLIGIVFAPHKRSKTRKK